MSDPSGQDYLQHMDDVYIPELDVEANDYHTRLFGPMSEFTGEATIDHASKRVWLSGQAFAEDQNGGSHMIEIDVEITLKRYLEYVS